MKKILSAIIAIIILASSLPILAFSADISVDTAIPEGIVNEPEISVPEVSAPEATDGEPPVIDATLEAVDPTKLQVNGGNYDGYWFASSYRSPYITSVKNQNPYGTCWAHSTCSLAESWLWKEGFASSSLNLSEYQLSYFIYKERYDPLGNLTGDYTRYKGSGSAFNEGANFFLASTALASWMGLTYESSIPYGAPTTYYSTAKAYEAAYRMTDARWFSMSDIKAAKNYIIENGAIGADYYHNDSYYIKKSSTSYYYPYQTSTNHAITIVGWDDNYSASNFRYNPGKNGAWLVKNSWGTGWGDSGYFWLSYYDKTLTANTGFAMQFTPSSTYENNYQYDGSTGYFEYTVNNNVYFANTFTINAYSYERLDAVMFGVGSSNINYTIQVYKNVTDFTTMNGTALLSAPINGQTSEPGFYTVPLGDSILLKRGDTVTVCIQFKNPNGSTVGVLVDTNDSSSTYYSFTNDLSRDRSYVGVDYKGSSTGKYFYNFSDPAGSYKCTARIKALTSSMGDDGYILQVGTHYIESASNVRWNLTTNSFYVYNKIGYRFDYWSCNTAGAISNIYITNPTLTMPAKNVNAQAVYYAVGDVNRDGKINARDKAEVTTIIKGQKAATKYADVMLDNKINARDKAAIAGVIKGTYIPTA
ncbi:MAG: hypothetical protein IJ389_03815 [Clostridia bacterium]|nr:hypothetical protein [Clostridia bacterium]